MRRSFLRPPGGIIERLDDVAVVLKGCRCQMPGAEIVALAVPGKRGREDAVRLAALARGGSTVDRRADQRMSELEPCALNDDEPRLLCRVEPAYDLRLTGAPHGLARQCPAYRRQRRPAGSDSLLRQPAHSLIKDRLKLLGHRQRVGKWLRAGKLQLGQH